MPERARRIETLRAGAPLRVGDATLLPVERVVVRSRPDARGGWVMAAVEPYALVVRDGGGLRVVALEGGAVSLERLREKLPGLDASLEAGGA